MAQLFGNGACTAAITEFLATMEVGMIGSVRVEDPGKGRRARARIKESQACEFPMCFSFVFKGMNG
jgi:hypothetical protein